jgi:tripartite ATP-independent transporter DctM subunit
MPLLVLVVLFAFLGAPVFAIMAGATELAWLAHSSTNMQHARFIAPDVLDERFAGSPILVTVPLFTFVGYTMAQSKAPERIVRAANALFGWLPGGLAIVCIMASAFFCTLTGGSAVTIVAVGGLLYPALIKNGYPKDYALGVIMTGGSLGLLLPPSLPILIYSLVAGIDFTKAFKAGIVPGTLMIALFSLHAMYMGLKHDIPRTRPNLREIATSLWVLKWELCVPVLVLGGLAVGLATIDEAAALAAVFVPAVELGIHRDLKPKDMLLRFAPTGTGRCVLDGTGYAGHAVARGRRWPGRAA